jgi:Ni,Fe-hydrogenase I cytochrome b subunit
MVRAGSTPRLHTRQDVLYPLTVRITHWLNAIAIIIMIGSGWRIYS